MTALAPLPVGRPERLVYFGTPEMAVAPLEALVAGGFDVALVVTGPDKRRGRGSDVMPSPVKAAAARLLIPVSHSVADALDVAADLGVVVAFGQLVREPVLQVLPMVNVHFSQLPRWRGAAPVERALLAGDESTGVCLMQLEVGLDTGPVLDCVDVSIGADETIDELRRRLVEVGSDLLVRNLESGLPPGTPQCGEPTYAAKLDPIEFQIDWTRPVGEILRLIRLGVAWTDFRGSRLKILRAAAADTAAADTVDVDTVDVDRADVEGDAGVHPRAGTFLAPLVVAGVDGSLELRTVQPAGRPPMDAASWVNGARPTVGEELGSSSSARSSSVTTEADA